MTVGQRIAQKRKEQNMSQEALGEKLGVSRQSIYKWESDAALPEIDKLVVLSKLFAVSVGWLLGVEEEPVRQEPSVGEEPELTENQLKMVEEIVGRYLAAQAPVKKPRRWPKVLAAVIVVLVGIHLFNRLEGLDNRYHTLQNTVGNLNHTVTNQISGITGRVEEILKAQNSLTADYGAELLRTDLSANTVTFQKGIHRHFCRWKERSFSAERAVGRDAAGTRKSASRKRRRVQLHLQGLVARGSTGKPKRNVLRGV